MAKRKEVINGLHNVFTLNSDDLYDISSFSYEQSVDENTILFAIADSEDVGKYITINGGPKIISENDNFIITDGIVFSGNGGGSGNSGGNSGGSSGDNYMERDGSNYIGSLDLVGHSISPQWTIKKQDGTPVGNPQDPMSLEVENGALVDFYGLWEYDDKTATTKSPTSCSGNWGDTLPAANTSQELTVTGITSDASFSQTISGPKSGLEVKNGKVVKASGYDTSTITASVVFKHLMYYGSSDKTSLKDLADLQSLNRNELVKDLSSNKEIKNIVCSNNYAYIAWPKSLGKKRWNVGGLDYQSIEETITITNQYGEDIEYLVMRSEYSLNATINVILKS